MVDVYPAFYTNPKNEFYGIWLVLLNLQNLSGSAPVVLTLNFTKSFFCAAIYFLYHLSTENVESVTGQKFDIHFFSVSSTSDPCSLSKYFEIL